MGFKVKDALGSVVITPKFDTAYSASVKAFAPAIVTATTDCQLVIMQGAANKVARLKKILVTGAMTAVGSNILRLERWSTAGTLGSAALTAVPTIARLGSPNTPGSVPGAPGLTISTVGTAAYTSAGTTSGIFCHQRILLKSTTITDTSDYIPVEWKWGDKGDLAPEIVGTTDYLALIGYPTATGTGTVFDITVQWEEGTY